MKKHFFRLPESISPQARNAFLIAVLLAIPHFLAAAYYLYLGTQFYALAAISFALGVLFGIGAMFSRRGQSTGGILLVLVPLAVSYPPIATLASGLGLVLGIALMIAGPIMAFQVLPRRSAWVMTIITAASGLATLLLDVFGSAVRPSLPGIVIQLLAVAVVGVLGFFIIRRAWSSGLRSKLLVVFISTLSLLAFGLVSYNYYSTSQRNIAEEERDLIRLEGSVLNQIDGLQTLALAIATDMANDVEVQAAFASGNRELLTELALPTFNIVKSEFDVKQYQFLLPPATSFLRLHQLDKFGDDLTSIRATVVKANSDKTAVSGIEIGRGGLGVRGVVPVNYEGKHIGAIDVGIDIGPSFLETIKKQYGVDVQIMLDNKAAQAATFQGAVTELSGPNEDLLFQAGTNDQLIFADESTYPLVMAGDSIVSQVKKEGRTYAIISFPLKDFSGNIIGVLEIISDRTDALAVENRAYLLTIIASLIAIAFGCVLIILFVNNAVRPINKLTETATAIAGGNLERQAVVESNDEIGALAGAFNTMTTRLREFITTLEQRVAERTRNLELAAEVSRTVSQVRTLDVMLTEAAELIRTQFNLYYVQVYLVNPSQSYLNLQAGTGHVGRELLDRSHRLPFNAESINGRAAVEKKSVVISDTTTSATFRPNPLLPDTRSEMAVPLLIGERVVGVLDMQSEIAGSLNTDILTAFEALAGQIAIAIQNANFLAETQQAHADVEAQAQRLTRANWVDYLDAIHKPEETGFVFEKNKITSMTGQSQLSTNENALTASISVTGESLGNLVVEMEGQSPITRTSELVTTVARQVAQQIESLRLLDSAERYRAEAEEASRRITREGWKDYREVNADQGSSYIYDLKEVRPFNKDEDQQTEESNFSLPLKVRDETVGKLSVLGLKSDDKESLDLVNAVAERLGAHIESLRQFGETQRSQIELDKRAYQLAAVAEISSVSSRELDIEKMLKSMVYLTQRKFGLYHAHVFTFNENTASLEIVACGWKEGDKRESLQHGDHPIISLEQEQSLVARVARTRQPVIINDVHNEPSWLPNPNLPDTASEIAVPLIIGDQILGVLDVQSESLNAFSEEDANVYATLASQVSTALQNAKSFSKSQQQAERESMLNTISQKIQSATTVEAVLQIAARELGHALGAPLTIAQLGMKDRSN